MQVQRAPTFVVVVWVVGMAGIPAVAGSALRWGRFVGGSNYDYVTAVATDAAGRVYVTGETRDTNDFEGAGNDNHGGRDAFVACLDTDGTLLWANYIGGPGNDYGFAVGVSEAGDRVAIAGVTSSGGNSLAGAANLYRGGFSDAFVTVLDADGTILWSAYLGGGKTDQGFGVGFSADGSVLVSGATESTDMEGRSNLYYGGAFDGFLARLDRDGNLAWSRYIGGRYSDTVQQLAVGPSGRVYLAGTTYLSRLPRALNNSFGGDDAFIAALDADGGLAWTRYIGGSAADRGYGIVACPDGRVVLSGYTESDDLEGASNNPYGGSDAFVAGCDPNGRAIFATYVGGAADDKGYGVAVDRFGYLLLAGTTVSDDLFPSENVRAGQQDAFVAGLSMGGTILMTRYVGGQWEDLGFGTACGANNDIVAAGSSASPEWSLDNGFRGGIRDGFVVQLEGLRTGQADLVVAASPADVQAYVGTEVDLEWVVENAGTGEAIPGGPGVIRTIVYRADQPDVSWADAVQIGDFTLDDLNAGERAIHGLTWTLPATPGTVYLRARVDADDTVFEQYESNNWGRIVTVEVQPAPPKPDLMVEPPVQVEFTVTAGDSIDIPVVLRNAGQADATAIPDGIQAALVLADDPNAPWADLPFEPSRFSTPVVTAQSTRSGSIQLTAPQVSGRYVCRIMVDVDDAVDESDETNNWGPVLVLNVQPRPILPDLQITMSASALQCIPGQRLTLAVDIANPADANAVVSGTGPGDRIGANVYVASHEGVDWLALEPAGRMTIGRLGPREYRLQQRMEIVAPKAPGRYVVRAWIDPDDRVIESDDDNNGSNVIPLLVDDVHVYPDLLVDLADVNDLQARPGQTIPVPLVIENRGLEPAAADTGTFETALFYADTIPADWAALDSVQTLTWPALDPNGVVERIVPLAVPDAAGIYYLRVQADPADGIVESNEDNFSRVRRVTVAGEPAQNRPPILDALAETTIAEGQAFQQTLSATDPDGDWLLFTAEPLPTGAVIHGDQFSWTPGYDQAGEYTVVLTVSDGRNSDSVTWPITVVDTNRPPVIEAPGTIETYENQTLDFTVAATDSDGDAINLEVENLPDGAVFDVDGGVSDVDGDVSGVNGRVGRLTWTPDYDQAGDYIITFHADDGRTENHHTVGTVLVHVLDVNRPPVAAAGPDRDVFDDDANGGQLVDLDGSASFDPDGDPLTYTWLDDAGRLLASTTDPGLSMELDIGVYEFSLQVSDGQAVDRDSIRIRVLPGTNLAPIADAGDDRVVVDHDGDGRVSVTLDGSASYDPDGTIATYRWMQEGRPLAATSVAVVDLAVGDQGVGDYAVTLEVTDDAGAVGRDTVRIMVTADTPGSQSPVFLPLPDVTIRENRLLDLALVAADPDGDAVTFSAQPLPPGATLDPATGHFIWRPDYARAGIYPITFSARTGDGITHRTAVITVADVPLAPWYARWLQRRGLYPAAPLLSLPIGATSVSPGRMLWLPIGSADPAVVYSADPPLPGLAVDAGTLHWTPTVDQLGSYSVSITAQLADHAESTQIVIDVVVAQSSTENPAVDAGRPLRRLRMLRRPIQETDGNP